MIPLRLERGEREDYRRLECLHYLGGRPATVARFPDGAWCVLRAVDPAPPGERAPALAGVLVVSMPTLNASWRGRAWPGRYDTPDPRLNARRLNDEVRCISRVIVDPRYRALGVATRLVRAYLDRPATIATEAIATMGAACPFFERAGMTPVHTPQPRRDARLLAALGALGLAPALLLDPARLARAADRRPELRAALVAWARASKGARRHAHSDTRTLSRLVARVGVAPALATDDEAGWRARAYVHLVDAPTGTLNANDARRLAALRRCARRAG